MASPDGQSFLTLTTGASAQVRLECPSCGAGRLLTLPEPLGGARLGTVSDGGTAAAILARDQGLWIWTRNDATRFRALPATRALSDAVRLDTLMYFSDDGQFLYVNPLGAAPIVVRMQDGVVLKDLEEHRAVLHKLNLMRSRILLFAEDDLRKLVGLHWAVELQDTRFIALIARYAETAKLPELKARATEALDAYLENAYLKRKD